jgi:hypothetical protein
MQEVSAFLEKWSYFKRARVNMFLEAPPHPWVCLTAWTQNLPFQMHFTEVGEAKNIVLGIARTLAGSHPGVARHIRGLAQAIEDDWTVSAGGFGALRGTATDYACAVRFPA